MATTEIIPSSELPGLEMALGDVEHLTGQLAPLRAKAADIRVQFPDRAGYVAIGEVLSEVRNLRKMGEARFTPFDLIVDRVKSFLRTKKQQHSNACEEIDAVCRAKMKPWEYAELEAARQEQMELNKKAAKTGAAPVTVTPNVPSVGGYRRSTTYPVEVLDADKLLAQWAGASGKHRQYLRQFITIDHKKLGEESRRLRDPDKLMKLIKGIRAWKD